MDKKAERQMCRLFCDQDFSSHSLITIATGVCGLWFFLSYVFHIIRIIDYSCLLGCEVLYLP